VATKNKNPKEKRKENGKTGIFIQRCLVSKTNFFAKNGREFFWFLKQCSHFSIAPRFSDLLGEKIGQFPSKKLGYQYILNLP
jgi:hypothetical protein